MAADTNSGQPVLIKNIFFYSKQEPFNPAWKGVVHLQFDNITWTSNAKCHPQYVAVRNEDTHLISAVLSARIAKQPVKLFAYDTENVEGNHCYLRAIGL